MKFLILCAFVFLAGCGSSSKKSEESPVNTAPTTDQAGNDQLDESPETKSAPEVIPEKATEGKKDTANSYASLSDAYRAQNEEGIARAATQILSQNPRDVKALNAMGLSHYRKSHFLAARYFFTRALQYAPKSSELYNNMGLVSLALNEEHEAIRSFKKALELNIGDGVASANLGAVYIQEHDYTKAQAALDAAVKKGMRETRTLTNYGISLAAVGKFDLAKYAYEDALKLNSNNKEALLNYAILLIDNMKQYSQGLDQLNRLKFLGPAQEARNRMNALEIKAKAGIK